MRTYEGAEMRTWGRAANDISSKQNWRRTPCFGMTDSSYVLIILKYATYRRGTLNSVNIVNNNQKKDQEITSVWQKLCVVCNQSHDRLHATSATRATSHMTGCTQPLQPVTWQVACNLCNLCNQSHDWLHATHHPCNLPCDRLHS